MPFTKFFMPLYLVCNSANRTFDESTRGFGFMFLDPDKTHRCREQWWNKDTLHSNCFHAPFRRNYKAPSPLSVVWYNKFFNQCFFSTVNFFFFFISLCKTCSFSYSYFFSFNLDVLCCYIGRVKFSGEIIQLTLRKKLRSIIAYLILVAFFLTCTRIRSWFQGVLDF